MTTKLITDIHKHRGRIPGFFKHHQQAKLLSQCAAFWDI